MPASGRSQTLKPDVRVSAIGKKAEIEAEDDMINFQGITQHRSNSPG